MVHSHSLPIRIETVSFLLEFNCRLSQRQALCSTSFYVPESSPPTLPKPCKKWWGEVTFFTYWVNPLNFILVCSSFSAWSFLWFAANRAEFFIWAIYIAFSGTCSTKTFPRWLHLHRSLVSPWRSRSASSPWTARTCTHSPNPTTKCDDRSEAQPRLLHEHLVFPTHST